MTDRHPTRGYQDEREPTPVGGISTERVRDLARAEAEAEGRRQQQQCVEEGPVCAIWKEIGIMRGDIGTLRLEQTKLLAVLGFWKWALPVIVAVVGIAVGLLAPRVIPQAQTMHSAHAEDMPQVEARK